MIRSRYFAQVKHWIDQLKLDHDETMHLNSSTAVIVHMSAIMTGKMNGATPPTVALAIVTREKNGLKPREL